MEALEAPEDKQLVVMPMLDPIKQVGEASIDVRLGTEFLVLRRTEEAGLDAGEQPDRVVQKIQERVRVEVGQNLWLHPGQFVLGSTLEYLRFPAHLSGYVIGRSTWGRVGLLVATAIMVGPGFEGNLTLELLNQGESPVALYPGCRIAQLTVHSLPGDSTQTYKGPYVGRIGPEVPQLHKERKDIARLKHAAAHLNPEQNAGSQR